MIHKFLNFVHEAYCSLFCTLLDPVPEIFYRLPACKFTEWLDDLVLPLGKTLQAGRFDKKIIPLLIFTTK